MKKLLRICTLIALSFFLLGCESQAQEQKNLGFNETFTFEFFAPYDTFGVDVTAITGKVSWDTTLFEYVSTDLDTAFTSVTFNDTEAADEGYVKYAWAAIAPFAGTDHMMDVTLRTRTLSSTYEIQGDFAMNEIKDTLRYDYAGEIGVSLGLDETPIQNTQIEAYPNPARPNENFSLLITVPNPQYISVKMFNVLGQEVKSMYNGHLAHTARVLYSTEGLMSGMYFFAMQGKDWRYVRPFTIIK